MKRGVIVAIVVFFASASAAPALAERIWWSSSIFGDGWCYGDMDLGECSVDIYKFDPTEWCRQPREATTSLEFCQNPDNYPRAAMDPEICGAVPDHWTPTPPPPLPPHAPSGASRVLAIVTDAPSYSHDDQITFSGTTQGAKAREIVTVVIESPGGIFKIRSGLTSENNTFELSPIDIRDAFGDVGVYTIKAFTNLQGTSYAATLELRYECNRVTRHSASPDTQSYVDRHNDDASGRAWHEPVSPDLATTQAQEPQLWDSFLIDPDGMLVKDRWCYGTRTYCEDTYSNWWGMSPALTTDGDLIEDEHWCFGSLPHCENNRDIWCKGTLAHCYDQAGHAWSLEHGGPYSYAWPTNITSVVSPWEFEWSRIQSVAYSIDAVDGAPPVFMKRPTSETVLVKGGNYTLSLSTDNFVVVDNVDSEPLIDCIVGGVPAIMQEVPHKWVLEAGTHYIQCTALDNEPNTSGVSYRLVVNTIGDLFPSDDYERLFENMMQFYDSTLNHDQMLKIIKYFHSAGILMFDIEDGNGTVSDPANAVCSVRNTDQDLLRIASWSSVNNAQKKHCLELLAERGAFSKAPL